MREEMELLRQELLEAYENHRVCQARSARVRAQLRSA